MHIGRGFGVTQNFCPLPSSLSEKPAGGEVESQESQAQTKYPE